MNNNKKKRLKKVFQNYFPNCFSPLADAHVVILIRGFSTSLHREALQLKTKGSENKDERMIN